MGVSTGHGNDNKKKNKQCNWWCAACGGQYDGRAPNKVLVTSRQHAPPKGQSISGTRGTATSVCQFDQCAPHHRYKDLHQPVKCKETEENKKAKVQWTLKEAKDRGVDFYDASHEK